MLYRLKLSWDFASDSTPINISPMFLKFDDIIRKLKRAGTDFKHLSKGFMVVHICINSNIYNFFLSKIMVEGVVLHPFPSKQAAKSPSQIRLRHVKYIINPILDKFHWFLLSDLILIALLQTIWKEEVVRENLIYLYV